MISLVHVPSCFFASVSVEEIPRSVVAGLKVTYDILFKTAKFLSQGLNQFLYSHHRNKSVSIPQSLAVEHDVKALAFCQRDR